MHRFYTVFSLFLWKFSYCIFDNLPTVRMKRGSPFVKDCRVLLI